MAHCLGRMRLRLTLVYFLAVTHNSWAGDEDHWSFQKIVAPQVPVLNPQPANPIDAFVRERLTANQLEFSPEAPPPTLLRRLHLDLTGLLPTREEVDSFQKSWDKDPEAAYSKAVDQLLASPHFGEQWARHWLDVARYGDSDGYLGDTLRPWAWVYRDWVIDAINRDMPFDQFSIEQLAGDLLPDPSQGQRAALGFHRNSLKNTEAGADRELDRTKRVVDRVATTGTAWLGLTLACAECHDHKHDPISQREFYELYAFFNNLKDTDISYRIEEEWDAYEDKLAKWESDTSQLESDLSKLPKPKTPSPENDSGWESIIPDKVEAAGTDLAIQDDGSILASGKVPSTVSYFVESPVDKEKTITAFRLNLQGKFGEGREKGKPVGRAPSGSLILSMFFPDLIVDGKAKRIGLSSAEANHDTGGTVAETILPSTDGWKVSKRVYQNHHIVFSLKEPMTLPAGSRLKFSLGHKSGSSLSIRHFSLEMTEVPGPHPANSLPAESAWEKKRTEIETLLASPPAKPSTKAQSLTETKGDERRETHIHIRGDYTQTGDAVRPNVPKILPPTLNSSNPSRLDLAHWLFAPENPSTARVSVNRIWQHLFGTGIVATSDDLGTYGDRPTHPELLDWLANEYRAKGWSRKKLIRQILMSDTYRQSSKNMSPDLSNQLLWRQNSYRVPAETVRDIHLVASGLFEPEIGGPGIHPPLPEFVTAVGRSVKWPESTGPDRYRRGMYIFLKRTVLYPMLTTFDAPDTSVACSRREKTNTPMQALTLLNDPVFFECSETLGRDLHRAHGENFDTAADDLFLRTLGRLPTLAERDTLRSAHGDFLRSGKNPELAMIALARVATNLDEFITRD